MKTFWIFLLFFISTIYGCHECGRYKRTPQLQNVTALTNEKAMEYLTRFGYMNPTKNSSIALLESEIPQKHSSAEPWQNETTFSNVETSMETVLKAFQQFNNLPITGELDDATKTFMAKPRCGVKDDMKSVRFNVPMPWRNQKVTYVVLNSSPYLSKDAVRKTIRKAFDTWSAVIPRDFEESSSPNADIKISFESGQHGDFQHQAWWPFDGSTLAHAGTTGDLHFDSQVSWRIYEAGEVFSFAHPDLLEVSIHELGHVLGLDHTSVPNSRMFPTCQGSYDRNHNYVVPTLISSDIVDIQEIYGPRPRQPQPKVEQKVDTSSKKAVDNGKKVVTSGDFWKQETIGPILKKHVEASSDRQVVKTAILNDLKTRYGKTGWGFFIFIVHGHENLRDQIQLKGDIMKHEGNGMYVIVLRSQRSVSFPSCNFPKKTGHSDAKSVVDYVLQTCPQIKTLGVLGRNGGYRLGWSTIVSEGFEGAFAYSEFERIGVFFAKMPSNASPKVTDGSFWNEQTIVAILKKHVAASNDREVVQQAIYDELTKSYRKKGWGFFVVIAYSHENRRDQIQLRGDFFKHEANGMYAVVFRSRLSDSYQSCDLSRKSDYSNAKALADYILQACPHVKSAFVLGSNGESRLGYTTIYLGGFQFLRSGRIAIMFVKPPT